MLRRGDHPHSNADHRACGNGHLRGVQANLHEEEGGVCRPRERDRTREHLSLRGSGRSRPDL
jgi:hypothetical protein